jgi:hypothetical protein
MNLAIYAVRSSSCNFSHWENCTIRVGHDYVCLNFGSNSAASVSVQDRGTRSGPKIIAELRELARPLYIEPR